MTNDRFRIPQDPEYFSAVGLAVVAFARLEWNAVWCCQRLQPNYILTIESSRKTAGVIGRDLRSLFMRISDEFLREKTVPRADEFKVLVDERNALLHGKPGTAINGDQRLFRNGDELSIDFISDFSDRCARAADPLNALLHNELAESCSVALTK